MANYGTSVYGTTSYGVTAKLGYSVDPISVLVINFSEVYVSWKIPSGSYSKVRLVRNQSSYPEHSEDGVIIWQETITTGMTRTLFRDGEDIINVVPIVPGKPIYYRMFLFTSDLVWVEAGSSHSIVPSDHGMQDLLVKSLPRVYTGVEKSSLSEIDRESVLYKMLDAYSFTFEEFITYLDLLNPDHTRTTTPLSLLPIELYHYGLDQEPGLPIKNQKQLIREAYALYEAKGTPLGLANYVESLSGYAPTITVSPNLLLNVQESTFYQSVGTWTATAGTLTASTEQVPTSNTNAIDTTYTCKIVASGAGSMSLGNAYPITNGVPVTPGNTYVLSGQVKSPSSAGSLTPSITYYDSKGAAIGSSLTGSTVSANNTWKSFSATGRATNYYATSVQGGVGDGSTIVYTTNTAHTYIVGTKVTVIGFDISGFNVTDATVTAVTSTTFSVSSSVSGSTASGDTGYVINNELDATYAGITLSWSAAGTYYVDMVCLQQGTLPSFDEARAIHIFIAPNKTNLIKNPSFEVNVTDSWTKTGSVTITKDSSVSNTAYAGSNSAKLLATGSWTFSSNSFPIQKGSYYTASGLFKASSDVTLTLIARDINGTVVENYDLKNIGSSADWSNFSYSHLVDAFDAEVATYEFKFSGSSGTFYLDCLQMERSPYVTDYFDGSLPSDYGAVWEGTANNSYTHQYFSKPIKTYRLGHTLNNWVPKGAFWTLSSYAGLEYNNLQV